MPGRSKIIQKTQAEISICQTVGQGMLIWPEYFASSWFVFSDQNDDSMLDCKIYFWVQ